MSFGAVAVVGAGIVGGVLASKAQSKAAKAAANAQQDSTQAGIDEQKRQFDAIQKLLKPYVDAGTQGLQGQKDLLGLGVAGSQQKAIDAIEASPQFASMIQQGENSILQNASATGGLRGGNTQAALAQFSPQVLNQLIEQRYSQLGGLATQGQNSATQVGAAGQSFANNASELYGQLGASQAGYALQRGQQQASMYNMIPQAIGAFAGYGKF